MAEKNFLLGKGERLTSNVEVPQGGGPKNPPYSFEQAKERIGKKLKGVANAIHSLPKEACPGDEVVALITMHPRYISKSDFPENLMRKIGVRSIGSKSKEVKPEKWGLKKHPQKALTEQIFVAGKREAFERWGNEISNWSLENESSYQELIKFEDITIPSAEDKIIAIPDGKLVVLEVVLHNLGDHSHPIIQSFISYVESNGGEVVKDKVKHVKGLSFVPVRTKKQLVEKIASFSLVRIVRGMPTIRPIKPITRSSAKNDLEIPGEEALNSETIVAVFDGGLPKSVDLGKWVNYFEPTGIGEPDPDSVVHGLAVTSALLFGHLDVAQIPVPYFKVDHYRVLDKESVKPRAELEYIDILNRILKVLDESDYQFVNLSLGPQMALEDHDVTAWTASLDERLAKKDIFLSVAAGNDGHLDEELGLNRIQPPSDGVNIFSVGACGSSTANWKKADYSCVGPGRRPGYVKPDGVAFGGSENEPFIVLAPAKKTTMSGIEGTSFSAPLALRTATAVGSQIGNENLFPRTLRALMIHKADPKKFKRKHVGWGRFEVNVDKVMTTADDEVLVIYQGELPIGEHLRADVPFVSGLLTGKVTLTATLVISPEVDPEYPGAYTRSGLEVAFRPHSKKFNVNKKDGTISAHPKTKAFFSNSNIFGKAESKLREDAHKWEPCLKNSLNMNASSLDSPCFDIYYHHREGNAPAGEVKPIPYSLIISIKAPKVKNLYNKIVQHYSNILIPLRPKVQVSVRV